MPVEQYCMYLRKSRSDMEQERLLKEEILFRHEKMLRELAKREKIEITTIYREIVSGETISARPVMQHLLKEVEKGKWSGVLVMEVERLARGDSIDQGVIAQAFRLSHTKIITPMKVYHPDDEFDQEYFEFGLFMSRREYQVINRRLQRGRLASVKEGKFVGSVAPYGYRRAKLPEGKGMTLDKEESQFKVVLLIFDLYTIGENGVPLGYQGVANRLNTLGIPSPKGRMWVGSTICRMVHNPVYFGKIRWDYRKQEKVIADGKVRISRPIHHEEFFLAEGIHQPIVSEKVWKMAQEKTSWQTIPKSRKKKCQNPLAGLVHCGLCGKMMVRRPYADGRTALICTTHGCTNVSVALPLVEKRIVSALEKWFFGREVIWQEEREVCESSLFFVGKENALAEIKKRQEQIQVACTLLEKGIYTEEFFLERRRYVQEEIKAYEVILLEIEKDLIKTENESEKSIIWKPMSFEILYQQIKNAEGRNQLLKLVLENVVYEKKEKGRWHHEVDDFSVVLYPKIGR